MGTEHTEPRAPSPMEILLGGLSAGPGLTWQAMLQSLPVLAAALADTPRQLAVIAEATRRFLESPQLRAALEELSRPGLMDRVASAYCAPYQQQVAELGLRPLNAKERSDFMVFAGVLAQPEERLPGRRPPLLRVAVAGQRPDIALALLLRKGLDRTALRSLDVADTETREELAGQAVLALGEQILPGIERQLNRLGFGELSQARSLMAGVTKDAYLVVAIRRELVRYLRKEALHREREDPTKPAALEDEPGSESEQEDRLGHWVIEQSIQRFLSRPRAKAIDAQLLRAIREDPERSSASIARVLGVPQRTIRYRRHLLMKFLSKDRGN